MLTDLCMHVQSERASKQEVADNAAETASVTAADPAERPLQLASIQPSRIIVSRQMCARVMAILWANWEVRYL